MVRSALNPFERILASLHEAALDPARWPSASALIDEALGTHGSTPACGDGESEEDCRVYFRWTCLRGQRRQDLERLWLETHYSLDEGIPRLRQQIHIKAANSSTIGILSAVMPFTTTRVASLRRVRRGSPAPVRAEDSWSCRMRQVNKLWRLMVKLDIGTDP